MTLDLSGLGLLLEKIIEAAVERGVTQALEKHHREVTAASKPTFSTDTKTQAPDSTDIKTQVPDNTDTKIHDPDSTNTKSHDPYSTPPTILQRGHKSGVEKRIPTEVWERIFKHLFPSQLTRVSKTCRTLYDIVSSLSVWSEIYDKAHPQHTNHLVGGVKPIIGKNPPKDFMLHICAESFRICELCLSVYSDSNAPKLQLAFYPLPVHVWRIRVAPKDSTYLPFLCKADPQDWVIRLCLNCRKEAFERYPESIPKTALRTLWGDELSREYKLNFRDVMGQGSKGPYSEGLFITNGRVMYGGDVGFKAASCDPLIAVNYMEARLKLVNKRATRDELQG